ncbi:MAG: DNA ligase-associated DEXH box helicase [Brevundimonas sp.]|nr:MAG: DNA ligase-associated DEXH box helicase [Brevundimonas sp.]
MTPIRTILPEAVLRPTPQGLWCPEGGFFIDPPGPVDRAVITHGHADHARAGHGAVLATPETLAIMGERYGQDFAGSTQALAYGERVNVGGVVFRHPPDSHEIGRLLRSVVQFPERAHLVGAYALGKAQRVIRLLREAGYDETIYVHGALERLNRLYEHYGVALGPLAPATGSKADFAGRIVIAPPSAIADRWSRRFPDPVTAFASGWMSVRARARQRGVELPLVLSDHADWDELTATLTELSPRETWITHGRDDALRRWAELNGLKARALHLVGYEDEDDD